MHQDTITALTASIRDIEKGDSVEAISKLDLTLTRLKREERDNVVIVWRPEDMTGFGNPGESLEARLGDCRKALEDCSHGWDVIGGVLGHNDTEN